MGTFLLWFQGDTFNVVQQNIFHDIHRVCQIATFLLPGRSPRIYVIPQNFCVDLCAVLAEKPKYDPMFWIISRQF